MDRTRLVSICVTLMVCIGLAQAADCPHFRGPAGDGIFPETGLLKKWPADGPEQLWCLTGLGTGYSSAVVADGTIYVTGMDDKNQGHLLAFGLDASPKWNTVYGPEQTKRGPSVAGTRGSVTVDRDRLYVMTGYAKLVILETAGGKVLKTVDLAERFGTPEARFGFTESVLVADGKVICTPGGSKATVAALNRTTGETIWQSKALDQASGYCSPRLVKYDGKNVILTMLANAVVAVDAGSGDILWQREHPHRAGVQPNPPLYDDGMVYISSGMGAGGALLPLAGGEAKWTDNTLDCQMQGMVLLDGCIYGTAQSGKRGLVCLDWDTGEALWNAPVTEMGVTVAADGMLYVYSPDGIVRLIQPSTEGFKPVGQFEVSAGTDEHWAHPTIANGVLYIRHGDALLAYNIKS